ncbi:MAG: hypothetical protein MUQ26_05530 [Armatimonadetes bacterium]|nr:hypothetical protein [Armatimonadota bacterium]
MRPSLSALAVASAVLGCLSLALGLPVYVLPPPPDVREFWPLAWGLAGIALLLGGLGLAEVRRHGRRGLALAVIGMLAPVCVATLALVGPAVLYPGMFFYPGIVAAAVVVLLFLVTRKPSAGVAREGRQGEGYPALAILAGLLAISTPLVVIPYAMPYYSLSGSGILAFATGLYLLVIPLILTTPALTVAVLVVTRGRSRRWHETAVVGLGFLLPLAAALTLAALERGPPRPDPYRVELDCQGNLEILTSALGMYLDEYDNRFPLANTWCDGLYPYIQRRVTPWGPEDMDAEIRGMLVCPAVPDLVCGYAFNAALSGAAYDAIEEPAEDTVVLFESDRGWNAAGGPELLPDEPRHLGGDNYLVFASPDLYERSGFCTTDEWYHRPGADMPRWRRDDDVREYLELRWQPVLKEGDEGAGR